MNERSKLYYSAIYKKSEALTNMTVVEIDVLISTLREGKGSFLFIPEDLPQVISHCELMVTFLQKAINGTHIEEL